MGKCNWENGEWEREIVNEWENGKWGENERENMKGVWENKERLRMNEWMREWGENECADEEGEIE